MKRDSVSVPCYYFSVQSSSLTRNRLKALNRSQSKRNVFDINELVALLPDIPIAHVSPTERTVTKDTGTQTQVYFDELI